MVDRDPVAFGFYSRSWTNFSPLESLFDHSLLIWRGRVGCRCRMLVLLFLHFDNRHGSEAAGLLCLKRPTWHSIQVGFATVYGVVFNFLNFTPSPGTGKPEIKKCCVICRSEESNWSRKNRSPRHCRNEAAERLLAGRDLRGHSETPIMLVTEVTQTLTDNDGTDASASLRHSKQGAVRVD